MIEVQMSKDIRDYEPKLLGPFTKRQMICLGIGAAYGVPLFFILPDSLPFVVRLVIAVVAAAPAFLCGFLDMFGYHLEQFAVHLYKNVLKKPKLRLYEGTCFYQEMEADMFPPVVEKNPPKVQKFKNVDVLDSDIKSSVSASTKTKEKKVKSPTQPKPEKVKPEKVKKEKPVKEKPVKEKPKKDKSKKNKGEKE